MRLALLKGFELRDRGSLVTLPPSAQRLLAFLALHDRPLTRTFVAGSIWTDSSQDQANASLRTALWRLRRPGCAIVDATPVALALDERVAVDVRQSAASAHRVLARRPREQDFEDLCVAGDLLPDWYDDWLLIERERFRQLRLQALERLCEDLAAAGRYAAATEAGLAAVAGEPLRESAHRALIRAHVAHGNVADALRQYHVYRDLLRAELGLAPSASMERLVASLGCSPPGLAITEAG